MKRLLVLALVLAAGSAAAQACCIGGGAIEPARLMQHEDALFGLEVGASNGFGRLDAYGRFVPPPSGATDVGLDQRLIATFRILGHGQLSLASPFVETFRTSGDLHEFGGGAGDFLASARWDFLYAGDSTTVPGMAVVAGAVFPTGRAPEAAVLPLGSDATGAGTTLVRAGVNVEQVFGNLAVSARATAGFSLPRRVGLLVERQGPELSVLAAVAYGFGAMTDVALSLSGTQTMDATLDGDLVEDSARRYLTLGLSAGRELVPRVRVSVMASSDLPFAGSNRPLGVTASALLLCTAP